MNRFGINLQKMTGFRKSRPVFRISLYFEKGCFILELSKETAQKGMEEGEL